MESVTRAIAAAFPAWEIAPEVSFSIWGERGIIDLLLWHSCRRALLIIELKTDIVDVGEMLGTLDKKRRLAWQIASGGGCRSLCRPGWSRPGREPTSGGSRSSGRCSGRRTRPMAVGCALGCATR